MLKDVPLKARTKEALMNTGANTEGPTKHHRKRSRGSLHKVDVSPPALCSPADKRRGGIAGPVFHHAAAADDDRNVDFCVWWPTETLGASGWKGLRRRCPAAAEARGDLCIHDSCASLVLLAMEGYLRQMTPDASRACRVFPGGQQDQWEEDAGGSAQGEPQPVPARSVQGRRNVRSALCGATMITRAA